MNTSYYAIIYPFVHKMCYVVTYVTFHHLKLSHYSKVYVPSYSFHEGLGHDLMLIGLKYIILCSFYTFVVFVPISE